jgi:hypothetical protein
MAVMALRQILLREVADAARAIAECLVVKRVPNGTIAWEVCACVELQVTPLDDVRLIQVADRPATT